jgi:leucyl/phenylalanyl-tRNA--protein transferase
MFSHATDASKAALAHLVRFLQMHGYGMIDCQMNTDHLASLGGREIPRADFVRRLETLTVRSPLSWPSGPIDFEW